MLLALGLLSFGCAPTKLEDGPRRLALRGATDNVIVPKYSELVSATAALASQLDDLAAAPNDADVPALQKAYLEARAPWEESQAFGFGPAADLRSQPGIDQSPIDAPKIDAELASDVELSVAHVRNLGANKRGLHAIEYLLFPADDAELQAALLADDTAGERRRQFLSAAGQVVASNARALLDAWHPDSGDYAGKFSKPGRPDSVSANVQSGLDTLLNQTVVLTEVVANVKLGIPLGVTTGGKVNPSAQESERSGATLSDIAANLRGIRDIYYGTPETEPASGTPSLSALVHARSPATDLAARRALEDAERAVSAIPEPFTLALEESPESVSAAFDSFKALKRVLATEVLGTLGASLKFSDNDGD